MDFEIIEDSQAVEEVQEEKLELVEGQFMHNGVIYELRYNVQKIKTIELVTKKSISAEVSHNQGIVSLQTLEALFSFALVEAKGLAVVKQSKAIDIFYTLLQDHGLLDVSGLVLDKLTKDVGFLFR